MADEAGARRMVKEESVINSLETIPGTMEVHVPVEDGAEARRLRAALDTMDEKITLLLARHERLAERFAATSESRQEAEAELARLVSGEIDPRQLEQRARDLETENERLSRHVAYLEERIEGLLTRVRYVLE